MTRILDFDHDPPAEVISRVVMAVHRAIDENFPSVANESKRFSKTVFANEDTVIERHHSGAPESRKKAPVENEEFQPSGVVSLPPVSFQAGFETSKSPSVDTKISPAAGSVWKRLVLFLILVTILAILFAIWAQQTLVF